MTAQRGSASELTDPAERPGVLQRIAITFTTFSERWVPDAFAFALCATVAVLVGGLAVGGSPGKMVDAWGRGFWSLLGFTLQMALVIITGSVLAATPIARAVVRRLAALPSSPRGAVAFVALFAMASSWLNWGFSLIFSAVLARAVARRLPSADYRALCAASFLGLGSVWAQGLSGSAALQMATAPLAPAIRDVVAQGGLIPGGIIPLTHTIFLWQSLIGVAIEMVVVGVVMWLAAPSAGRARSAADLGLDLGAGPEAEDEPHVSEAPARSSLNSRLERSPFFTVVIVGVGAAYLVRRFLSAGSGGLAALNLDTINLTFLLLGFALHGTPERFLGAVRQATPAVWGVLIQFPFYGAIAAVITDTHLSERIASLFVAASSQTTLPALVALYSTVLGVFVPSGGGKWLIEAPYVMEAGHRLHVHLGWMVAVYDLGEALANLLQPFWMLPTLALFGLRARDVMGYTFVVFLVLAPLVLVLVTLLGMTLSYPL